VRRTVAPGALAGRLCVTAGLRQIAFVQRQPRQENVRVGLVEPVAAAVGDGPRFLR